jgi:hypothetical protein
MSYGHEVNSFLELARRYGPEWKGIVLCHSTVQLKMALQDFSNIVKARVSHAQNLATMPGNGASMRFAVVNKMPDAQRAFEGREFTHIIWLHRPDDAAVRHLAQLRLRSRKVPACDCRVSHCLDF